MIHLSLLLVAATWGSNFVSMKYLLRTIDPVDLFLLRLILSSLFFGIFLLVTSGGLPAFTRSDWLRLTLIAILGITISTSAVAFGTQMIPAALASLIVTSNPVFTAIISRLILGEPLTSRKITGIAIAFAGFMVVLLFGGQEAEFNLKNSLGVLVMLFGPLTWALYTVLSKPFLSRCRPPQFAGLVTIIGTLAALPLFLVDHSLPANVASFGPSQWLATMVSTLLALVLAYVLWYRGLAALSPTQVSVYLYLVPVFGVLGAWLLLGERITIFLFVGGITILAGVILTNTTRRRAVQPAAAEVALNIEQRQVSGVADTEPRVLDEPALKDVRR